MNFVAFDFETANAKRNSACSLALTVVQNNQIVDELYSLINPKTDFDYRNIAIHGIKPQMVVDSPDFSELWPHIENFFTTESLVVAHNAPFDCSVLCRTLESYNIEPPHFNVIDTVKTSRSLYDLPDNKLDTICENLDINLKHHHNALDDSQACAEILLKQLECFGPEKIKPFTYTYPRR
ncbi:3'-5' exonuclease [Ligilactobacillus sp.]|uniref:3'-5' exonuclease n=1 Tax=Ligilactobacillus sp. TaxID=2767921 RepID=UPI002FDFA966